MSYISSSIRNCRASTDDAARQYSERFLNPHNTVCLKYSSNDNLGRPVPCENSIYRKAPGCNDPLEIVSVENSHRPQYVEEHKGKKIKQIVSFEKPLNSFMYNSCSNSNNNDSDKYNQVSCPSLKTPYLSGSCK